MENSTSLKFLLLAGFMGYIGSLCHSLPGIIMDYILYLFSFSKRTNSDEDSFAYMCTYYALYNAIKDSKLKNHLGSPVDIPFKEHRYSSKYISNSKVILDILEGEDLDSLKRFVKINDTDSKFDTYRPLPIGKYWVYLGGLTFLRVLSKETVKSVPASNEHGPNRILPSKELDLSFIGFNAKKKFREFERVYKSINEDVITVFEKYFFRAENIYVLHYGSSSPQFANAIELPRRLKETIFLDNKDEIFQQIERFISKRRYELCTRMGMSFKCNILLYGMPGTGKTSLAKIITSEYTSSYEMIMLNKKSDLTNPCYTNHYDKKSGKFTTVNFIEEIDLMVNNRDGDKLKSDDKDVLKNYLEFLDGPLTPPTLFTVATTNYIDRLDPAMLRRFDLVFEIKPLSKEIAKEMTKYYGGEPQLVDEWYKDQDLVNQSDLSKRLMKHIGGLDENN